ncbi:hypothetical protein Tco_0514494 [Tanacetum coccineum]|uniref:Uncharacterized protein n=1 Tax=Tanacetum coccineum TaxID=301880 RepID=A0ABQ4Y112_9ASTR
MCLRRRQNPKYIEDLARATLEEAFDEPESSELLVWWRPQENRSGNTFMSSEYLRAIRLDRSLAARIKYREGAEGCASESFVGPRTWGGPESREQSLAYTHEVLQNPKAAQVYTKRMLDDFVLRHFINHGMHGGNRMSIMAAEDRGEKRSIPGGALYTKPNGMAEAGNVGLISMFQVAESVLSKVSVFWSPGVLGELLDEKTGRGSCDLVLESYGLGCMYHNSDTGVGDASGRFTCAARQTSRLAATNNVEVIIGSKQSTEDVDAEA